MKTEETTLAMIAEILGMEDERKGFLTFENGIFMKRSQYCWCPEDGDTLKELKMKKKATKRMVRSYFVGTKRRLENAGMIFSEIDCGDDLINYCYWIKFKVN